MQILVLNNDLMERTTIQQVLQSEGHEIIAAENSDTAMQLLREGGIRFVIADRASTDIEEKQFIQHVRDAQPPYYIYILLITPEIPDAELIAPHSGADDYLGKPIIPIELKVRVQIGKRIIDLGDRLVQAWETLENTAMFDELTTVLNYKAFLALARGELERARRGQSPLSLIALDIDNLASINEQFGEAIANDVLTVVARGIREKSRPYDGVGRYEDDTFLVILPGVIAHDAERITDRILKSILNTDISLLDGTQVDLKLSAGIASSVHITAATEIEMLIAKTMEAVRLARHDGRDQVATVFV